MIPMTDEQYPLEKAHKVDWFLRFATIEDEVRAKRAREQAKQQRR